MSLHRITLYGLGLVLPISVGGLVTAWALGTGAHPLTAVANGVAVGLCVMLATAVSLDNWRGFWDGRW